MLFLLRTCFRLYIKCQKAPELRACVRRSVCLSVRSSHLWALPNCFTVVAHCSSFPNQASRLNVSWTFCPCSWSSQSAGSTVSKHQSLGGSDLQTFRGRWSDLSDFLIADMERAARRPSNGVVTANLPASTEDTPLPEIISWHSDLTSLLTASLVRSIYLGHFKNHRTELSDCPSVQRSCDDLRLHVSRVDRLCRVSPPLAHAVSYITTHSSAD